MTVTKVELQGPNNTIELRPATCYAKLQAALFAISGLATVAVLRSNPPTTRALIRQALVCAGATSLPFAIDVATSQSRSDSVRLAGNVPGAVAMVLVGVAAGIQLPCVLLGARRIWDQSQQLPKVLVGLSGLELFAKPLVAYAAYRSCDNCPEKSGQFGDVSFRFYRV